MTYDSFKIKRMFHFRFWLFLVALLSGSSFSLAQTLEGVPPADQVTDESGATAQMEPTKTVALTPKPFAGANDKYGTPEPASPTPQVAPPQNPVPPTSPNIPAAQANGPDPAAVLIPGGGASAPEDVAVGDDQVYLNATDADITDIIKQISKATGTNFLIDDKIKGKITIISEKPMSKDMAYQAFLSALEVMGYTTVTTPAGLVKIVQTKDAITEPVDIYKESSPNTDKFITRILQVRNISANDISSVIKTLVSKEGNLFAYPATNSLIITDTGSNIGRIMNIIRELDQEGPQEVIEIIPIQYADASDITDKILQLFEQDSSKSSSTRTTARRSTKGAGETELEDTPSVSKVIADERTNSVIILGTKRSIIKVKALISQLDTSIAGAQGSIHVYYMKYANAKEMSEVLSSLVSGNSSSSSKSKKSSSSSSSAAKSTSDDSKSSSSSSSAPSSGSLELTGEVKVTADEGTNSLLITASPKDYQTLVDQVLSKLDIARRQVYLEAIVMELSVNKTKTTGFSGNLGSVFQLFGSDMTGFGAVLPLASTAISSLSSAAGGLAGGVISDKSIDFTTADGSTVSVPAVSAIINALQTDTDSNVLSTPSILTLDNEEAQIQVGQEVPTPSGTITTSGVSTTSVTREDVGIILKITPQISESENVRLKIDQEVSNVVPGGDPLLGPTLTKRKVDTVVVAKNKQTIVIGGLIDDHLNVGTNKVPILGDIPIVGSLFKNKSTQKLKTNIIVFITPYIIRDKEDYMAILRRKVEERNLFIENNYGPTQRKLIRQSIANHTRNLLDYKDQVPTAGTMVPNPSNSTVSSAGSSTEVDVSDTMYGTKEAAEKAAKGKSSSSSGSYEPDRKVKYKN